MQAKTIASGRFEVSLVVDEYSTLVQIKEVV